MCCYVVLVGLSCKGGQPKRYYVGIHREGAGDEVGFQGVICQHAVHSKEYHRGPGVITENP